MRWRAYTLALAVLVLQAGCSDPKPPAGSQTGLGGQSTSFGRPAVLARDQGERLMLRGRKPLWIKVDPQTLGSHTLTAGLEDMPPGDSIGVHKHLGEDEVVFVHRGSVEVTLGDSIRQAKAGATVFIPRGTWIGFRVTGTDTATIFFVFNAPAFEKCLRRLSAAPGQAFVPLSVTELAATRRECHHVVRAEEAH